MNGYYDGFDGRSNRSVGGENNVDSDKDGMNDSRSIESRNEDRRPWDREYAQGRTDLLGGNSKNSSCDLNNTAPNSDAYYATYKVSYEAGWLAAELQLT